MCRISGDKQGVFAILETRRQLDLVNFTKTSRLLVSLPNRTAERRGRLSVTNVTGLLLSCFVGNSLNIDVFFSALLQKDLFEGM